MEERFGILFNDVYNERPIKRKDLKEWLVPLNAPYPWYLKIEHWTADPKLAWSFPSIDAANDQLEILKTYDNMRHVSWCFLVHPLPQKEAQ